METGPALRFPYLKESRFSERSLPAAETAPIPDITIFIIDAVYVYENTGAGIQNTEEKQYHGYSDS